MNVERSEFKKQGRSFLVPMCRIEGREVISVGRWLRIATQKDEEWLDCEPIGDPVQFANALGKSGLPADIFTFLGPIGAGPIDGSGKVEIDNVAVIETDDYKAWWEGLPQEARKNTRRAAKRGLEIRCAAFDDDLVAGIKQIYDEEPIRQGRKFWHYGKDLETVRRENASYLDRCQFLGAYFSGELVGFIKIVYVGETARIMQILSLNSHQDKRPMTALIAKAANICHQKGLKYLAYGKYTYKGKGDSSITEFKRRLGFKQQQVLRYYIALSWRGQIALRTGAHRGCLALLPTSAINHLLRIRKWYLEKAQVISGWRRKISPIILDAR